MIINNKDTVSNLEASARERATLAFGSTTPTPLATQVGGSHYKDMVIQPIEYCQKNKLGYCESNAIKYISRHRKKNGKEDILKAIHVLNLLLELEYVDK